MKENNKIILITGCAGFIGSALTIKFLSNNYKVIGLDNINDYYDINLKNKRLRNINNLKIKFGYWKFYKTSIENKNELLDIFEYIGKLDSYISIIKLF